ncbi:MAG: ImmA/IrrE family metallo-endopeptidase [Pirellulales bacterium]|nr:ImmA/IrrE family metallo-endopeptidase [Pirellulales bacterium]
MANYVDINPELIRWALTRSGLPREDFSETVTAWMNKEKKPTLNQLEGFARKAMVPFGFLFLDEPPMEELPVPDYRTRKDKGVRSASPNLIETVFEMERRKDWMHEYLTSQGYGNLAFVGSAGINDPVKPVAEHIRKTLRLVPDWAERQSSYTSALAFLRRRVEESGILIFVNGIVGNNRYRSLDPDEFEGFVLVDSVAPLIFVNGADYKVAQMFTVAHELAHVWIGQSALFDLKATVPANYEIEMYCNEVAAELLVPEILLSTAWPTLPKRDEAFLSFASRHRVSPIVVARRAKDLKLIGPEDFFRFYERYMKAERKHEAKRQKGGDFWRNQHQRIGYRFGTAVANAALEGAITYTQAYELTRLHGKTYVEFVRRLFERGDE